MTPVYNFKTQLALGQAAEVEVSQILRSWFRVERASFEFDKLGIDFFLQQKNGAIWSAQLKTDFAAARTGNIFLEFEIASESHKSAGWSLSCIAQVLIVWIPDLRKIIFADTVAIKKDLIELKREYGLAPPVKNKSKNGKPFFAYGILMPISHFETRYAWSSKVIAN